MDQHGSAATTKPDAAEFGLRSYRALQVRDQVDRLSGNNSDAYSKS